MHLFEVHVLGLRVNEGAIRAQVRGQEVDLVVGPGLIVEAGLAEQHRLEAGGGGQGAGAVLEVVAPVVRGEDVAHVVESERPVRDEEGRLAWPHVALHAVAHGQVRLHGDPQFLRMMVGRIDSDDKECIKEGLDFVKDLCRKRFILGYVYHKRRS